MNYVTILRKRMIILKANNLDFFSHLYINVFVYK